MHELDLSWREVITVVRRRRRLIRQAFGVGTALMVLGVFVLKPTYQATATLLVTATRSRDISTAAEALPAIDKVTEEDLNSYAELFKSEILVRRVLTSQADAGLMPEKGILSRILTAPRDALRTVYRFVHDVPPVTALDDWVDEVVDHVKVEIVKKTNLIDVSYRQRGVDPEWTAGFINALVDAGLQQSTNAGEQREATRFFEAQRGALSDRVRAAEAATHDFFVREGLDSIPEQRTVLRTRLAELTQALQDVERDRATAGARVQSLQREIRLHPEVLSKEVHREQNQAIQFLKPRILEKEMQRNELLSLYAPNSDRVRDIERELADARQLLTQEQAIVSATTTTVNPTYQTLDTDLASAKVDAAALQGSAGALRSQIEDMRQSMVHLDGIAAEHSRLEADLQAATEALEMYTRKQEQARLGSALDQSRIVDIAVMQAAEVPSTPEHVHGMLLGVLGALCFLCVAVSLAFVRDLLDPAVRGARDVEVATGLPVLAEIPTP